MGFDYLHGEPLDGGRDGRRRPLGPTGGAALYSRAAFDAVGGFDERIFLYYEDLDLALRLAAAGARCRLAPAATARPRLLGQPRRRQRRQVRAHRLEPRLHAAPLRGDVAPARAARVLAFEGAICAGQLLLDRTAAGHRAAACAAGATAPAWSGATAGEAPLLDLTAREALALRRQRRG